MGVLAAFHIIVALVIAFWPREQVVTPGTAAIFGTIPPWIWSLWFLATGVSAARTVIRTAPLRIWMTWCGAFPLGLAWVWGFGVAIPSGRGNVIFALMWCVGLAWWGFIAARMHYGGTETRWGGD